MMRKRQWKGDMFLKKQRTPRLSGRRTVSLGRKASQTFSLKEQCLIEGVNPYGAEGSPTGPDPVTVSLSLYASIIFASSPVRPNNPFPKYRRSRVSHRTSLMTRLNTLTGHSQTGSPYWNRQPSVGRDAEMLAQRTKANSSTI